MRLSNGHIDVGKNVKIPTFVRQNEKLEAPRALFKTATNLYARFELRGRLEARPE